MDFYNSNNDFMDVDILSPNAEDKIHELLDDLRHDDVERRLHALDEIHIITNALGPEESREKLIPFLSESIGCEEQVLCSFAEKLRTLIDAVGGPQYAPSLLPPLESMASSDVSLVARGKAILSLRYLLEKFDSNQISQEALPLLKRLTSKECSLCKSAAISIFPVIYVSCSATEKMELQTLLSELALDLRPIVRKSVLSILIELLPQLSKSDVLTMGLNVFTELAQDEQESMRLLSIDCLIVLAALIKDHDAIVTHLLPVFLDFSVDRSVTVKRALAINYLQLSEAFGNPIVEETFVDPFVQLAEESDVETRVAIAAQISGFAKFLQFDTIVEKILPCVQRIAVDELYIVRCALASSIGQLLSTLGDDSTLLECHLPNVLCLFNEEDPVIQMNLIISKLSDTDEIIEKDSFWSSYIIRVVQLISENRQWRTRLQLIELFPQIAERSYRDLFKEGSMFGFCIAYLHDPVYAIRESAIANLEKIGCLLGATWIKKVTCRIIQMLKLEENSSYKYRMSSLFALTKMAEILQANEICCFILPNILNMVDDPVPNIRFNVAKSLQVLIPLLLPENHYKQQEYAYRVVSLIKDPLTKLCDDSDSDVQFYSTRALNTLEIIESNINSSSMGTRQLINSNL